MTRHDCDASWGALAVAILFECPLSPEEAIELYENGSLNFGGKQHHAKTIITSCRITRLRKKGCAWWAISALTDIQSPDSYIVQHRNIIEEIERRNLPLISERTRRLIS